MIAKMTTSRAVMTELRNLLDYLETQEIAVHARPVLERAGRVSWPQTATSPPFLLARSAHTPTQYAYWVQHNMFSAMLFDGSLLQISYTVDGGVVSEHRLAWVPAPYEYDPDLVRDEPALELLSGYEELEDAEVQLRTPIRFDYDLNAAAADHPASHMTINGPDCRVACLAAIRVGRFVQFLFANFYPAIWRNHRYLRELPKSAYHRSASFPPTEQMYVAWADIPASIE